MGKETLFVGLLLMGIGFVFIYNNKNMAKGAAKFYRKLYEEKNLKVMFRAAGIILVLAGIILIFFK